MTLQNGRGLLNLIPKLQTFANSCVQQITALAAQYGTFNGWKATQAIPTLIRLCDPPEQLIIPKSPALIFSVENKTIVTDLILYDYSIEINYIYASPVERQWGDDALYACGLAAEGIYAASRENRPAGINAINNSGAFDVSYLQESAGQTPLLCRQLTISSEWQIEEDY